MLQPRHASVVLAALLATLASGCGSNGPKAAKNKSMDELIAGLQDKSPKVRSESSLAIRQMGSKANHAIPSIIAKFDHDDPIVRKVVAESLSSMMGEAYPEVIKVAKHENPNVRATAMLALGSLSGDVPPNFFEQSVPAILEGLKDPVAVVRVEAAGTANRYCLTFLPHLDELLRVIKEDSNKYVRCYLIQGVGNMGVRAKAALPLFEELQKDPDGEVSAAASAAFAYVSGKGLNEVELPSGPTPNAPPANSGGAAAPPGQGRGGPGQPGQGGGGRPRGSPPSNPPDKTPPKDG